MVVMVNEEEIIQKLIDIKDGDNYPETDADCMAAVELIRKLQEYRNLVFFIASDYVELSHDKVMWQRDDYKKRCTRLIAKLEKDDKSC